MSTLVSKQQEEIIQLYASIVALSSVFRTSVICIEVRDLLVARKVLIVIMLQDRMDTKLKLSIVRSWTGRDPDALIVRVKDYKFL